MKMGQTEYLETSAYKIQAPGNSPEEGTQQSEHGENLKSQLCAFAVLCVHCCFFTLDVGLLARSRYSEGPATGHLDTGFSRFPCA